NVAAQSQAIQKTDLQTDVVAVERYVAIIPVCEDDGGGIRCLNSGNRPKGNAVVILVPRRSGDLCAHNRAEQRGIRLAHARGQQRLRYVGGKRCRLVKESGSDNLKRTNKICVLRTIEIDAQSNSIKQRSLPAE